MTLSPFCMGHKLPGKPGGFCQNLNSHSRFLTPCESATAVSGWDLFGRKPGVIYFLYCTSLVRPNGH